MTDIKDVLFEKININDLEKMGNDNIKEFIDYMDDNKLDYLSQIETLQFIFFEKKNDDYINYVVKKINLYKKLNQIKIVSSGLKKILDEFNAIKSESYEKIQNIFDYINNENKEIIENDIEHKIKNLDIDYNNINDNYYKFFIKYEKYQDSINWLRKKK